MKHISNILPLLCLMVSFEAAAFEPGTGKILVLDAKGSVFEDGKLRLKRATSYAFGQSNKHHKVDPMESSRIISRLLRGKRETAATLIIPGNSPMSDGYRLQLPTKGRIENGKLIFEGVKMKKSSPIQGLTVTLNNPPTAEKEDLVFEVDAVTGKLPDKSGPCSLFFALNREGEKVLASSKLSSGTRGLQEIREALELTHKESETAVPEVRKRIKDSGKKALDPLSSWNESPRKSALIKFIAGTTSQSSPDFIPVEERIAVFDNDGTLWGEQPLYFQLIYAIDKIKEQAPNHPEWKEKEPFASILKGDMKAALAGGEHALMEMVMATHANMTGKEFQDSVSKWLEEARHPKTGMRYHEMVYQPMLELLKYLRFNGYKTFIVSGGGIDFIRAFAEETYGIPPEQVIGSSIKAKYEVRDGKPAIVKIPELNFIDDKEGKPVAIHQHIGRRPILAFGNSDGDFQMLEWTTAGKGPRLGLLVHHTDDEREVAYDRESSIGKLVRGLDEAADRGWLLIDMKEDWNKIYPGK